MRVQKRIGNVDMAFEVGVDRDGLYVRGLRPEEIRGKVARPMTGVPPLEICWVDRRGRPAKEGQGTPVLPLGRATALVRAVARLSGRGRQDWYFALTPEQAARLRGMVEEAREDARRRAEALWAESERLRVEYSYGLLDVQPERGLDGEGELVKWAWRGLPQVRALEEHYDRRNLRACPELEPAEDRSDYWEGVVHAWYWLPKAEAERILRAREEAERAREEAARREREGALQRAKETGEPVVIRQMTAPCSDPHEECNMDLIQEVALPDGRITTRRIHTW